MTDKIVALPDLAEVGQSLPKEALGKEVLGLTSSCTFKDGRTVEWTVPITVSELFATTAQERDLPIAPLPSVRTKGGVTMWFLSGTTSENLELVKRQLKEFASDVPSRRERRELRRATWRIPGLSRVYLGQGKFLLEVHWYEVGPGYAEELPLEHLGILDLADLLDD